jgi:hypothetical protein
MFGDRAKKIGTEANEGNEGKDSVSSPSSLPSLPSVRKISSEDPKKERLIELEKTIRGYRLVWKYCGEALVEVLESELYVLRAPSFERYLREKWQIGRRHGHDLVAAAKIQRNLEGRLDGPIEVKHLLSLRAALTLGRLPDDVQAKCLARVIELTKTKSPTAKQIAEVIERENWPVKPGLAAKPKKKKQQPLREKLAGGLLIVSAKPGADLLAVYSQAVAALQSKIQNLKSKIPPSSAA